jgi:polar amino acid transport system substrate-binding protein
MKPLTLIVVTALGLLFSANLALAHETVTVVTELSPPHQTFENGRVSGTSTDIVRRLLELSKVQADFKIYPWARAFNIAKSTPNTLIYNMARTPEREKQFHWIGKVAAYQFAFVKLTSRTDIDIQSLQQARQYSIAAQRDDISSLWLLQNGFSEQQNKVVTADISSSWDLLLKGKVDLIVDDPQLFDTMQAKLKLPDNIVDVAYPISALDQETWLAINIDSSAELVSRLKSTYHKLYE